MAVRTPIVALVAAALIALAMVSGALAQTTCQGTFFNGVCKPRPPMFPYGYGTGGLDTQVLAGLDDGNIAISTSTLAPGNTAASWGLYGAFYTSFFIGVNGIIGMTNGQSSWTSQTLPTNPSIGAFVAPFWADVDTRSTGGEVMYRLRSLKNTADLPELQNCTNAVRNGYLGQSTFSAKWCAIITWDSVARFPNQGAPFNTFQCILISDGVSTFSVFNYAANSYTGNVGSGWWDQSTTMASANTFATIGFDAGDAVKGFYARPRTLAGVQNLWTVSNTLPNPIPGRLIYKINDAVISNPPTFLSNDARLRLMNVTSPQPLIPAFSPTTLTYTLIVNNSQSFVLRAFPNDTQALMYVNGIRTLSGNPTTFTITGPTTIQVSVVSVLGPSLTYTINADIQLSTEARLSALAINAPPTSFTSSAFNRDVFFYTATIPSTTRSIGMTATSLQPNALVRFFVPPSAVFGPTQGGFTTASNAIILNYKTNGDITNVYANVTAQDSVTRRVYQVRITMTYDTSTTLQSVTINPAAYSIALAGNTYSWTVASADATSAVTVTPTFAFASVSVGTSSGVGAQTSTLGLAFGLNNYVAVVTSEAGSSFQASYNLAITRPRFRNSNVTSVLLTTDLGVTIGPFQISNFAPSSAQSGVNQIFTITAAVPFQTTSVRLTAVLSDTTFATATLGGVALNSGLPSAPQTLTTDPFAGATTPLTVVVTAHDTTIVNWFTVNVQKPAVPVYTLTSTSCVSIRDTITFSETKSLRMVIPANADTIVASALSNVTNGASRLFIRKSELPVISGSPAWAARSYPVTANQDRFSSAVLVNPTSGADDYYLSYAPPSGASSGAFSLNITFCAQPATTIALNTNGVGAIVQRNGWTFFATQLTAEQYPAGIIYTMTPTLTGAQPVANAYFRTYADMMSVDAIDKDEDKDYYTIYGDVNAALNPSGTSNVYTARADAPAAGSRVLYAIYALGDPVSLPTSGTYVVTVNCNAPTPVITLVNPLSGPTIGGSPNVVITGTDFEPIGAPTVSGTVTIGGNPCQTLSYDAQGRIVCTPPAGEGTNNQIVVTLYSKPSAAFVSPYVYTAPTLSFSTPTGGPTLGQNSVVITGTNLGQSATVTIGGKNCAVTGRTATTITCTVPAGEGTALVVVTAAGQANIGTPLFYTYNLPVPQGYSCGNAATLGNNPVVINGFNFGSPTATVTVTIGGNPCNVQSFNQTVITCLSPSGAGQAQAVLITVSGRTNVVALGFNYGGPTLTSISPNPVRPTQGTLVVIGTNFGPATGVTVSMNLLGGLCTVQSKNHTHIICTAPPRNAGVPPDPFVVIAGQPSPTLLGFSYAAPQIFTLSRFVANTDGTTVVQVIGQNFLGAVNDVQVLLNGAQCTVGSANDTVVSVTIPAGSGQNLPLFLRVGGLQSNSLLFNYSAPVITGISGSPRCDGSSSVVISGFNFATSGSVTVSNGGSCTSTGWTTNSITCNFPVGVGSVTILVTVGVSSSNAFPVVYVAPSISNILPAAGVTTAGTDTITINGRDFGPATESAVSSFVEVRVGNGLLLPCPRVTWSDTVILCTAPVGNGTNLSVFVRVSGQFGSLATLSYRAPTLTGISAPSYPTAGGATLVITGTSLDSFGNVTVAGVTCPIVSYSNTGNTISCTLPAGGGLAQPVVLRTVSGLTNAVPFPLDYTAPAISQVIPNTLSTNGQTVLLRGINLGGLVALSSVTVSGTTGGHTVTSVNHTHALFTLGSTPTTSTPTIVWTYNGQPSPAATVGVDPPVISNINPTNGPTGPAYNLTLNGNGFGDGTRATLVFVGTTAVTPLSITAFRVIISMPPGGFNQQPVSISVGGSVSNNALFQFDRPTVLSATPNSGIPSSGSVPILVRGTSFSTNPTAFVGASPCITTTVLNDTALICSAPTGVLQNQIVSVQVGSQTSVETNVRVSYEFPTISFVTPTSGPTAGCSSCLQLTGSGFGPAGTGGVVKVGLATCVTTAYTFTSVTCNLPAGLGVNQTVQITVNGNPSNTVLFSYNAPSITGITPNGVRPNTIGGTVITIGGSDFGSTAGSVSINGTATCNVLQPSDWSNSQIICTTPAMAGTVTVVVTAGSGQFAQASAPASLSYASPVIAGSPPLVPANGPTAGGNSLLIFGSQFFTSGVVTIGGRVCVPSGTGWTQTRIECTVPAGSGGVQNVVVNVFGQTVSFSSYQYDAPVVTNVLPQFGATNADAGGNGPFPVIVVGNNFGIPGSALTAQFGGVNCASISSNNHTHLTCSSVPNGVGTGIQVRVTLALQANTPVSLFNYFAPVITSITSAACTVNGNTIISCPTLGAGAGSLTINGQYFGTAASVPAPFVTVNGAVCAGLALSNAAGTQVTCTLPAGTSFNIPVVINVGGQASAAVNIAYAGPRLTASTLRESTDFGGSYGVVNLPNINGTEKLVVKGTFLDQFAGAQPFGPPIMRFGPSGTAPAAMPYTAAITRYNNTDVEFNLPSLPVGRNLVFVYSDGQQFSPESTDTLNFPLPVFVAGTIKAASGAVQESSALAGKSPQGEDLQFKMRFVGNSAAALTIFYDSPGGAFNDPAKQCQFVTIATPYDPVTGITQLQCRTQPGAGGPYVFKVTAYGATSAESTDTYSYPQPPLVYGVRGSGPCINNLAAQTTSNCPTLGGVDITINGTNFADGAAVKVGTGDCLVTSLVSSTTMICTLPAGTGLNQAVTVFSGNLLSAPSFLLSYRQANITSVVGCATTNPDGSTANCPRSGSVAITINGESFGLNGAQVFVGATPCAVVVHDFPTPDRRVVCQSLPRGVELNQAVLLLQSSGAVSVNNGLLSYSPCATGTFQLNNTDYACTACSAGSYTDTVGQAQCIQCPLGQFQALPGRSFCSTCGSGSFAGSLGSTTCTQCAPRTASVSLGAASCGVCGAGTFANGTGNFLCASCPLGTAYDGFTPAGGVTACSNCTAGSFTNVVATSTCTPCPTGAFASASGATACALCPIGRFQSGQGGQNCQACNTGSFAGFPGTVTCSPCDAGTFQNVTAGTACLVCPPGTSSGPGATTCVDCVAGRYNNKPGQGSCLACPDGSFSASTGAVNCVLCSPGSATGSGNPNGWTTCTNCTAGRAAPLTGQALCDDCQRGTFTALPGQPVCVNCANGKYSALVQATGCADCGSGGVSPLGQYNANQGQSSCEWCPVGFFQDQTGQSVCKRCAIGTYGGSQASGCTPCGVGSYTTTDAQPLAGCLQCAPGTFSSNPISGGCTACGLGETSGNGAGSCTACAVGFFARTLGAVACTPCPAGQFNNNTQASACQTCAPGFWSAGGGGTTAGPIQCTAAQPGEFVAAPGAAGPDTCLAGTYSNTTGASTCTSCELGKYQPNSAATSCLPCQAGSATNLLGQNQCQPCAVGTFQGQTGQVACTPCAAGSAAIASGAQTCPQCQAGKFAASQGSNVCTDCPIGKFHDQPGVTACTDCPAGSRQPQPGQTLCVVCNQGQFQDGIGAGQCKDCDLGFFAPRSNMSACLVCGPGFYAGAGAATACSDCLAGTFSNGASNTACLTCSVGSFNNVSNSGTCTPCLPGELQPLQGATVCAKCSPGSANPAPGQASCTPCVAGKYASGNGNAVCLDCPVGNECPAASTAPSPCAAGFYADATGQAACTPCAGGFFNNVTAQTACAACASGSYQASIGKTVCTACDFGKFANTQGSLSCEPCPSGYFAASTGRSVCGQCTPGSAQPSAGQTACLLCGQGVLVGTFSGAFGALSCTGCDIGTFANTSSTGATACVQCGPGTVAPTVNSGSCTPCVAGKFVNTAGQGVCVDCDSGLFANVSGLSACYACNLGTFSVKNIASGAGPTVCSPCAAGTFANTFGVTACLECPLGTANNFIGQTVCSDCRPGTAQSQPGQVTCPFCAPGTFTAANASIVCSQCPPGYYNPDPGALECRLCETGKYFNASGATDCNLCALGTFAPTQGSINCLACDIGKFNALQGQGNCSLCAPGSATSTAGSIACALCNPGTFAKVAGLSQCEPCAAGSASNQPGALTCTECDAGTVQSSSGRSSCLNCTFGTFVASPGQQACLSCPAGTSTPNSGQSACTACGFGTYASAEAQTACDLCAPGRFTDLLGQVNCADCAAGTSQPQFGRSACSRCAPGSFQDNPGRANCTICAPGSATPNTGRTFCPPCPTGTFSNSQFPDQCRPCPEGSAQQFPGKSSCDLCSVAVSGTHQDIPGQAQCKDCGSGRFANFTGQVNCTLCEPGKFMFGTGATVCDDCPLGTASSSIGAQLCQGCLPGTFMSRTGSLVCDQCPVGRYQSNVGQANCVDCPPGTYASTPGQPVCSACPVGQFQPAAARSSCMVCGPGTYNNERTGRLACTQCDIGTYAPGNGSANCLLCEPGSATNSTGSQICTPCSPGFATSIFGAAVCQACDTKEYSSVPGSRVCVRCQPGTANPLRAQTVCADCVPGTEQPAESQATCNGCRIGFSNPFFGSPTCTSCAPGKFAATNSSVNCTDCAPGSYQVESGRGFCVLCPPGSFSTSSATRCTPCAARTAAPNSGASTCYACDVNGVANAAGTGCSCNVDYAGLYFYDSASRILKVQCRACPEGAVCDSTGTIWDSMLTRSGYWSPFVGTYYRCLLETQCVGGRAPYVPGSLGQDYGPGKWALYAANGTFVGYLGDENDPALAGLQLSGTARLVPAWVVLGLGGYNVAQLNLTNSAMATTTDSAVVADGQCASNRGFVLCSLCNKGYTESIGGDCRPCVSTDNLAYVFTGGIILVFLGVIVLTFYVILESGSELMQVAMREDEKMARQALGYVEDFADDFMALRFRHGRIITVKGPPAPKPDFTFKLKIVLGFLQIMSNLAINLDIRWPTRFKQFVQVFSPTNLDFVKFASVDCITQGYDYYSRLILFSLAPPILLALIFLVYFLPNTLRYDRTTREGRVQRKRVLRNFWKLVQFALFLVYPSVSSVVLRVYVCQDIGGTSYLQADFTIQCNTQTWRNTAYVSLIMILAYVVGIPLLFALALFRYRNRLNESGARAQYGFLYDAYERKIFFFELVDMAHKLAVTSLIAFLPLWAQLPGATVIVVAFLCIILVGRPYLRKGDDKLHVFAQIEICLGVVAGNVLNTIGAVSDRYDAVMSAVLVFIVVVFFLYFLAGALGVLWKLFRATAFAQRFAWARGEKKQKKTFKKNYFAAVLDAYKIDRNSLRRQPLGQKAGEEDGVAMARNPLFMAGGSAGTALVDEHDQTVVEVMVNPLLLDNVRQAVEEKARQDALAAAEAEKRRLAREAELKKQKEDEELAEKQYQELLLKAQNANEEDAKALREQAAALKEKHESPMRIDDVFFTASDPLAQVSGAVATTEFSATGATSAAGSGSGPSAAAPSGSAASDLLDPSALGSSSAAAPDASAAAGADPAVPPVPAVALPDLGSLDIGLPTLDSAPAAAPAVDASASAPRAARTKKEKEID